MRHAVQAAESGDVIRVWPGLYQAFTVRDRSPTIVRVAGSPGYQFSTLYGPPLVEGPPTAPFAAPDPWGPASGWRFMGFVGPSGTLLATQPLDDLAPFGHEVLHLQGAFLGAERYWGSPSWSAIQGAAW